MKKIVLFVLVAFLSLPAFCQSCYWVFLTDKQGTTFDPYAYFDAKAIERYQQCGADLYDISNYPLNDDYVRQIDGIALGDFGQSRWLNAVAVTATPSQIARIEQLPFVSHIAMLGGNMQQASVPTTAQVSQSADLQPNLVPQLVRMQGEMFRSQGFDGTGIRIAVLDGGFPRVNTHAAFKHLRDNHRILDTWNFPDRKADVYGWNSHGLMTLSCITGIIGDKQLGLATGAEFLLYRTEVESEPFKEEVWWMRAMERADQHGANIISSSLGYGKERYWTKDMDGTSYVAKAGNLAARKGILVCCSAGNEADEDQWKTIVTPSDADSVLCVGGIIARLDYYNHISFSSFGPSADGRLKPNVAAFGHAAVASNLDDNDVIDAYGTSFSCPLVAGFAACAWQLSPGKTAMEMFDLIQQSADRYPYFDYALGYGVPQASFFVGEKVEIKPTFVLCESKDSVEIRFLDTSSLGNIFFNKQRPDGTLVEYSNQTLGDISVSDHLAFYKGCLDSCTLNVWYKGYTSSFTLSPKDRQRFRLDRSPFEFSHSGVTISMYDYDRTAEDLIPSNWGSCARWRKDFYFMYGNNVDIYGDENLLPWSPSGHIGFRIMRACCKAYSLGMGLEWNWSHYNYDVNGINKMDSEIGLTDMSGITKKKLNMQQFDLEVFQRVRFLPGGALGSKGLHWDLGLFVGWNANHRYRLKQDINDWTVSTKYTQYRLMNPLYDYHFVMGAITRITYDFIGVYVRFEDSIVHSKCECNVRLPSLQAGIQFCF